MTYQAITTKYLGPSNVRGSRVKATCAAGSLTLGWDDRWNSEQNHAYCAMQLAKKLDWQGPQYRFHHGITASGESVFVCESGEYVEADYVPRAKVPA